MRTNFLFAFLIPKFPVRNNNNQSQTYLQLVKNVALVVDAVREMKDGHLPVEGRVGETGHQDAQSLPQGLGLGRGGLTRAEDVGQGLDADVELSLKGVHICNTEGGGQNL